MSAAMPEAVWEWLDAISPDERALVREQNSGQWAMPNRTYDAFFAWARKIGRAVAEKTVQGEAAAIDERLAFAERGTP